MRKWFSITVHLLIFVSIAEGNFEDTRCRCICPSTELFRTHNSTPDTENYRRYYTKTEISPSTCNSQTVVKDSVRHIVDEPRLDAFLANCNCKYESRNSLLLKVVVFFVICVLLALGSYMAYLLVVDPIIRRQRHFIPYRRHDDDMDENMFAHATTSAGSDESEAGGSPSKVFAPPAGIQMRPRTTHNVLDKVEAEQTKWKNSVEEQRRNVMMNHTMLN
ncbi:TMEM9 domain-containing protein [Ditylenchus destructor]|uniref:TMEM9 domain-containing protein n=1 Tax=Ditylenchus destructor TaxID=166010 RepID=A0AAD4NA60_9BILA|nr:TMEM9 domain-containing protein [Ditylenchus destructor]